MEPNPEESASVAELRIDIIRSSERANDYARRITAPDGTSVQEPFRVPLSPWEIEAVRDAGSGSPGIQRSWATQTADFFKEIGTRLFDSLFDGSAGRLYMQASDAARRQGAELRLQLFLDDSVPAALPWELLYDPYTGKDFLALTSRITLTRLFRPAGSFRPKSITPPLKLLLVAAAPPADTQLRAEAEHEVALLGALAAASGERRVKYNAGTEVSLERLEDFLDRERPHVLHYVGAGMDLGSGDHVLMMSGSSGRESQLPSGIFVDLLESQRDLRLTFLSGSNTDLIAADIAHRLPEVAALGMRGDISAQARLAFAEEFYRSILRGDPLDAAVSRGRRSINHDFPGSSAWGVPVLFLRGEGALLDRRADVTPATPVASATANDGLAMAGKVIALDPSRQEELEYLHKKLAVTTANLNALQMQKKRLGEALPDLVASQIADLEVEHSETSRRIAELER